MEPSRFATHWTATVTATFVPQYSCLGNPVKLRLLLDNYQTESLIGSHRMASGCKGVTDKYDYRLLKIKSRPDVADYLRSIDNEMISPAGVEYHDKGGDGEKYLWTEVWHDNPYYCFPARFKIVDALPVTTVLKPRLSPSIKIKYDKYCSGGYKKMGKCRMYADDVFLNDNESELRIDGVIGTEYFTKFLNISGPIMRLTRKYAIRDSNVGTILTVDE